LKLSDGVDPAVAFHECPPNQRLPSKALELRLGPGRCAVAFGHNGSRLHPSLQFKGCRRQTIEPCGRVAFRLAEAVLESCHRLLDLMLSLPGFRNPQTQFRGRFGRKLSPCPMINGGTAASPAANRKHRDQAEDPTEGWPSAVPWTGVTSPAVGSMVNDHA
jgi:hypothetical protein